MGDVIKDSVPQPDTGKAQREASLAALKARRNHVWLENRIAEAQEADVLKAKYPEYEGMTSHDILEAIRAKRG